MKYLQIISEKDRDIPYLLSIHNLPEISRFISINEKTYFKYVTSTENVFYFKAYKNETLAATVHFELSDGILYISLLVIPEFQKQGIGTEIIHDIQNGVFGLPFKQIKVSIDKLNTSSLSLFSKMNFIKDSEDEDLIDFIWPIGVQSPHPDL